MHLCKIPYRIKYLSNMEWNRHFHRSYFVINFMLCQSTFYYEYRRATMILLGNRKENEQEANPERVDSTIIERNASNLLIINVTLKSVYYFFDSRCLWCDGYGSMWCHMFHVFFVAAIPVTSAYHYPFRKWGELWILWFSICEGRQTNRLPLRGRGALVRWSFYYLREEGKT